MRQEPKYATLHQVMFCRLRVSSDLWLSIY